MWMYTHVPQDSRGDAGEEFEVAGALDGAALEQFVERMEDRIEAGAPGFRSSIIARQVQGPADLERANPSLVGGDSSGGTTQMHQQLVFRPVPGLARAETPARGRSSAAPCAGTDDDRARDRRQLGHRRRSPSRRCWSSAQG